MAAMKNLYIILATMLLLSAFTGCSQHGDLPTEHSFIPAPTPTVVDIVDNNDGTYIITVSVDDDTAVQYYRVYSLNVFTGQMQLYGTSESSEIGVDLATGQPVEGYPVGISAVTVENVEGAMTTVLTPPPGGTP